MLSDTGRSGHLSAVPRGGLKQTQVPIMIMTEETRVKVWLTLVGLSMALALLDFAMLLVD